MQRFTSQNIDGNGKAGQKRRRSRRRRQSSLEVPTPPAPPASTTPIEPPGASSPNLPEPQIRFPTAAPKTPPVAEPKPKTYSQLYDDFISAIFADNPLANRDALDKSIKALLDFALREHDVSKNYRVLIMYDNLTLMRQDTDKIYRALTSFADDPKPVALVITSAGGQVDAGYLISKLCREFSPERFITIVPRRAKSAATLICCGADEIHMGSMSELGPIDPQVGNMPALGLKNAIQHLLELAGQYPAAAEVLAKYLHSSLELINLGYYERVAESATQYAERLLKNRKAHNNILPESIAKTLVYAYKDHGFVIDTGEAQTIFGPGVIVTNSFEYRMGNALYSVLSAIDNACDLVNHRFYFYGSSDSAPVIYPKKK